MVDNPMDNLGRLMRETNENLALRAQMAEQTRLLTTARALLEELNKRYRSEVGQRQRLVEENFTMYCILAELQAWFWFFLLPRKLKARIRAAGS